MEPAVPPQPSAAARLTKLQRAGLIFAAVCAFALAAAIVAAALGPFAKHDIFGTKAHAIGLTAAGVAPILAGGYITAAMILRRQRRIEDALVTIQQRIEELAAERRESLADTEARIAAAVTEAIRHFGWTTYARGIEDAPSVPGSVIPMPTPKGQQSRANSRA